MPLSNRDGSQPGSLVDLLRERAAVHGSREAYRFVIDPDRPPISLTYAELDERARALAHALSERARPGDRALLLYPFGPDYPVAFMACLYAGLVAVPAFPPDQAKSIASVNRVRGIALDARPELILTMDHQLEVAHQVGQLGDHEVTVMGTSSIESARASSWTRPDALESRLAFLQYTSGATGTPKGVMVGHENLIEHQRLSHRVFGRGERATTVSWLPFYHDMGLIGSMLYPMYSGGLAIFLPPTGFLRRPLRWLYTISETRASVSTGPNFAYDLCATRATEEDLERLDLSCWELTVCGAEPVRPETLDRFCETFGPAGFRRETFLPCFGMAEATLMVTGGRVDRVPTIRWFDRDAVREGRAVEVERAHARAQALVACGSPMDDHELRVVDPVHRHRLPEGVVGEIWLRGPSVARGYWGLPERSETHFQARIAGGTAHDATGLFMRTGDMGFCYEGELYALGRLADRLEVGPLTIQPHDVERAVEQAGLSRGVIAFCREQAGGTELCVAADIGGKRSEEWMQERADGIAEVVASVLGFEPHRVLLIPPRSIARTSSGKQRRFRFRAALAADELTIRHERRRD